MLRLAAIATQDEDGNCAGGIRPILLLFLQAQTDAVTSSITRPFSCTLYTIHEAVAEHACTGTCCPPCSQHMADGIELGEGNGTLPPGADAPADTIMQPRWPSLHKGSRV